jgi:hypothetical protein
VSETETIVAVGIVLLPLTAIWLLALFNIVARRGDLSIGWKGIWSAVVILIPYLGVLIYAIVRPPAQMKGLGNSDPTVTGQAIDQIHRLTTEHDSGAITDGDFASRKALIFGIGEPAT